MEKNGLRPVKVNFNGDNIDGYFHRFIYMHHGYYSETKALIELTDGRLRYFDPFFVQFVDRLDKKELLENELDH